MTAQLGFRSFSTTQARRALVAFVLLLSLVVPGLVRPAAAEATVCPTTHIAWDGAVTAGVWSAAGNWIGGVVPTASDDVCIPATATVTVDGAASAQQLVSDGAVVVDPAATLAVAGKVGTRDDESRIEDVQVYGTLSLGSGGMTASVSVLGGGSQLDAASGAALTVYGDTDLTGGTISITGLGDVYLFGRFIASAPTTISSPDGAFSVAQCRSECSNGLDGSTHGIDLTGVHTWSTQTYSRGIVTNHADLTVSSEGQSGRRDYGEISGDFTNYGTMVWEPYTPFGDNNTASTFTNEGLLVMTGQLGFVGFTAPSLLVNNGFIDVQAGGRMNTTGVVWENTGDIAVADGSILGIYEFSLGDSSLTNSGTISLGTHPSFPPPNDISFLVEGDFENTSTGTIVLGVTGPETSEQYSRIRVDGMATLDGALVVERRDNYDPPPGETYPVMTYASKTGDFAGGSGLGPFFSGTFGATETSVTRILPDADEAASDTISAGGTVETNQTVSTANPLATSVQTPTGGLVSIVEQSPPPAVPDGYEALGVEFSAISAPEASVADPLLIRFTLDWSVWGAHAPQDVTLARNGVVVAECVTPGQGGVADPDPCVGQRQGAALGDLTIDVRTSMASDWVVVTESAPPDSDGDGVADSNDACPATPPLGSATTDRLKKNRYAVDAAGVFVDGNGTDSGYTIADTAGCDEHQIIDARHLGKGHTKFGLSRGALRNWVVSASG